MLATMERPTMLRGGEGNLLPYNPQTQLGFSRNIVPPVTMRMKDKRRGFILGKFMPLHKGHEALIEYGLRNCDELTVLVCSLPTEPIDGKLRHEWVKNRFPNVRVLWCNEVLPQEPKDHPLFWDIWTSVIQRYHPEEVDVIFGSEDYVVSLARHLTMAQDIFCKSNVFDKARQIVPISGTKVRNNPMYYWKYINKEVQKHFIRRVLIIGTESTGKSTLTENLAKYYDVDFMPEYAREYIDKCLDGDMNKLEYEHFDEFAIRHRFREDYKREQANGKVFFTDTDAITTLIFSREYYGKVSKTIIDLANSEKYDLVLLCNPDVPWVDDGQRNLSHKRYELHYQFQHELGIRNMKWVEVSGSWDERWKIAVNAVNNLLRG